MEDEEEKEHYDDTKRLTRRYKVDTDRNGPRWEIGVRFNSKENFKELTSPSSIVREEVAAEKKIEMKVIMYLLFVRDENPLARIRNFQILH